MCTILSHLFLVVGVLSLVADRVGDIVGQSLVYTVELFAVVWQRVGEVTEALRFLDLYVGHVRKVLIVSDGRAFWGWTLSALV